MSRIDQVRFAAHAWNYALGVSIRTLLDGPEREVLIACEERPTIPNIRAALAIGRHRPWLPLIESALIEIGVAAINDILKEAEDEHRD
ncbi:MAG: hypothetical protein KKG17_06425 [Alphaproteobacteria bacterium]|nr:hypothetical protein [Alphaproteobacteria bacterium]